MSTVRGYTIVSRTPKNADGRNRPYHAWMHGIGQYNTSTGKFRPKSGGPKYMFRMFDQIRKDLNKELRRKVKEGISRTIPRVTTVKGSVRSFGLLRKYINVEVPQTTFEVAQKGKRIAKQLAPVKSGALINAIDVR